MVTQIFTGKKVDTIELLNLFPPTEGEITQYYGRIGQGKTYGATADILDLLRRGNVVYANWRINWDGYDERNSVLYVLLSVLLPWRKRFYKFNKENLHYIPIDEKFHEKFEKLTDCYVFLDEGHVVFDSYEMARLSLARRASILHTRHFNRSICIISQRPTAIHVAMRANVNRFYKMEKVWQFGSIIRFRRTEFQDMQNETVDDNIDNALSIKQYWGRKEVFDAYPSKYLRGNTQASQKIMFEAYDFGILARFLLLLRVIFKGKNASLDGGQVVKLVHDNILERQQGGNETQQARHGWISRLNDELKKFRGKTRGAPQASASKKGVEKVRRNRRILLNKNVQDKRKSMEENKENGVVAYGDVVSGEIKSAEIISPFKLTVKHLE